MESPYYIEHPNTKTLYAVPLTYNITCGSAQNYLLNETDTFLLGTTIYMYVVSTII